MKLGIFGLNIKLNPKNLKIKLKIKLICIFVKNVIFSRHELI